MIRVIVLDIDGVLTDGTIIVDSEGHEQKKINLKDIDAVFELKRRGFLLAAITGEETGIVEYFRQRFPWDYFYKGSKNKTEVLRQIEKEAGAFQEEICYVGDGKYDAAPLSYAGLGICPADAIDIAKEAACLVLQKAGGAGCLWELLAVLEQYNQENSVTGYFFKRLREHTDIFKIMASDQGLMKGVMQAAEEIAAVFNHGGTVFLCGNGGSAADAQHIAAEFVSRFYMERRGLPAEALTVNTSILTAVGNDYGYGQIFVRQLEARADSGDMLIGLSTSGNSPNVLSALKYAKDIGMTTVLMTGLQRQPELCNLAQYLLKVPSTVTPRIQEAHIFLGHVLAEYVEERLFSTDKEGS